MKARIVVSILIGLLITSCLHANDSNTEDESIIDYTGETTVNNPTEQSNLHELEFVYDHSTLHFSGVIPEYDESIVIDGQVLNGYDIETLNVYRPLWNNSNFEYLNCEEWQNAFLDTLQIVHGDTYSVDVEPWGVEEAYEYNQSLQLLSVDSVGVEEKLEALYPDTDFGDYVICRSLPAVTSDLYQIYGLDDDHNRMIIDVVVNRDIDIYLIRESIDGIPIGVAYDMDCSISVVDNNGNLNEQILSYFPQMYYDGSNIYEIATLNEEQYEIVYRDCHIISFEDALATIEPELLSIANDTWFVNNKTYIYAAELVYITDHIFSNDDYMLYPYWFFYCHINGGEGDLRSMQRRAIVVNAITGELLTNYV